MEGPNKIQDLAALTRIMIFNSWTYSELSGALGFYV